MEEILAAALERAGTRWPGVQADEAAFARLVGERLPPGADVGAALARLSLVDLCLASACLAGVDGAVAAFETTFRPDIDRSLRRRKVPPDRRDEIWQTLCTRLFVGGRTAGPRLATYTGRSPLKYFVGVCAERLMTSQARADHARHRLTERLAREPAPHDRDAELSLVRHHYRESFEAALRAAVAELDKPDRALLRLHLVARLSTTKIGKMFRVSQATISRRLGRVREDVWSAVAGRLQAELRLATEELESITRAVASQLDAHVSVILEETGEKPRTRRP